MWVSLQQRRTDSREEGRTRSAVHHSVLLPSRRGWGKPEPCLMVGLIQTLDLVVG